MMDDPAVLERIGAGIGEHGIKQCRLFVVRRHESFELRSIAFHHNGGHPAIGKVREIADRIRAHGIGDLASGDDLARPGKHLPGAEQSRLVRHDPPV
ncbi:hypothetical protein D3C87_2003790 [compost metagenome]